jgi:tetratricopeptide (TPR) repeat protein
LQQPTTDDASFCVDRSLLGETAFLNGWFAILVNRDHPKARGCFEACMALDEVPAPDGPDGISVSGMDGTAIPPTVRRCCRRWVACTVIADMYRSGDGARQDDAMKYVTLGQEMEALAREAAASLTLGAATPSVGSFLKPLSKIRTGGSHGDGWHHPQVRLLQDCTAFHRVVRARVELEQLRRIATVPGEPFTFNDAPSEVESWRNAATALQSEVIAVRARLAAERVQRGPPLDTAAVHRLSHMVQMSLKKDPHNVTALLQRAKLLHDHRRYAAAAEMYHEVMKETASVFTQRSVHATAKVGLGWTHLQRVSGGISHTSPVFDLLSMAVAPPALLSAMQDLPTQDASPHGDLRAELPDAVEARDVAAENTPHPQLHILRAVELFQQVLAEDPTQAWALCGLGRALTLVPARVAREEGLLAAGDAFHWRSTCIPRQRIVVAQKHFQASWRLSDGRCHWASYWLGDGCLAESRRGHERAIGHYRACLQSCPTNSWALTSLALTLHHQKEGGHLEQAIDLLRKAVSADERNVWALWGLSSLLPGTNPEANQWRRLMVRPILRR